MNNKMNILAIAAHPDDIEILCAGTLALYSKKGHQVYMYHACDGDKGGINKTPEQIREERRKEAINSAKVINAVSIGGDFHDAEIYVDLDCRLVILDVIRRCNADIILTHCPNDYHVDHVNTSKLVFDAIYMASIPALKTKYKEIEKVPLLYYMDTVNGLGFIPEEYVDISRVMDLKIKMVNKHKSQIKYFKDNSNIDFIDMVKVNAMYRGYQCNVKYAEGFRLCFNWLGVPTKRLLP